MIRIQIQGKGLGRIKDRLHRATSPGNKRATGNAVADVLVKGNRRARLAAIDRFGRRLIPRKNPRRDGARGPTMAPHHSSSRAIRSYFARVTIYAGRFTVTAGWNDAPWLVYHARGAGPLPVRDLMGVDPQTQQEAFATIRRMTIGTIRGTA